MTDYRPDASLLLKAETLAEALPYLQRYAGATFVVKYGGHAMGDPEAAHDFAEDVVLLKAVGINPVVVHGGGPQIGAMLKASGVESRFVDGLRVTDAATMKVAEMVLSGAINKEIVSWIGKAGGRAVGLSGKDARLVTATKMRHPTADLGLVGEPDDVDTRVLDTISRAGMIPVVAPVAIGPEGESYNINADTMAGAIAIATGAERLFLLTDVAGVLDKQKRLLTELTPGQIDLLQRDGTISGGMIPKLQTCVHAVEGGVDAAVILDGRVPHGMLIEIFTREGAGTLVRLG
ncbi:MAG: acetylglutamate kinase [Sphingomonas fennica]